MQTTSYVRLADGRRVAYEDTGLLPGKFHSVPLLLLHGAPLNRHLWDAQRIALAAERRVVTLDLPGFGESDAWGDADGGPPAASMDRYVDDLLAFMDQRQLDRVVLGGHSMGGYIAFAFWRRARARIRAFVLSDTRADTDTETTRTRRQTIIDTAQHEGIDAVADMQLTGLLGATTRETHPDVTDIARHMMRTASVPGVVAAQRAMLTRADATPWLATIDVPTLLMTGDEDVLAPPRVLRAMHEQIANSSITIITDAGHMSALEQPHQVTRAMMQFLHTIT